MAGVERKQKFMADPYSAEFAVYEQPLAERVRLFLRLELLLAQTAHHSGEPSSFDSRAAINGLLEISALIGRGDVRSEIAKELERQMQGLARLQDKPEVDSKMLDEVLIEIEQRRAGLVAPGAPLGQALKGSEFLNAIKNRASIPGGACQFDLPSYHTWLRQPHRRRTRDLEAWLADLNPLRAALATLMRLMRASAAPYPEVAEKGIFQKTLAADAACPLIRVMLPVTGSLFPEISGGRHRITIRFFDLDVEERPKQTQQDVHFKLSYCYF
jgi:cell division protein ZapD